MTLSIPKLSAAVFVLALAGLFIAGLATGTRGLTLLRMHGWVASAVPAVCVTVLLISQARRMEWGQFGADLTVILAMSAIPGALTYLV